MVQLLLTSLRVQGKGLKLHSSHLNNEEAIRGQKRNGRDRGRRRDVKAGATSSTTRLPTVDLREARAPGTRECLCGGAEYWQYCAAARAAAVVGPSRFGTISKLHQTTPSSTEAYPSTPPFALYPGRYGGSFYTSSYIDSVPVETED